MKNCEQKSQIEVEILRLKKVDLMRENLQIMRFESQGCEFKNVEITRGSEYPLTYHGSIFFFFNRQKWASIQM